MAHPEGARSPKADDETKAAFRALVPTDERVTVRPMFGGMGAFANTWMFMGLFAEDLFVRLDEEDRAIVFAAGGGPLEPMPGKPMRDYVTIPNWRADQKTVRRWAEKGLGLALSLPPKAKQAKAKQPKAKQ